MNEKTIQKLKHECVHRFTNLTEEQLADKWMSINAFCLDCKKDFGWRCKDSPDNVCHYINELVGNKLKLINKKVVKVKIELYDIEDCIFCGQPEERK